MAAMTESHRPPAPGRGGASGRRGQPGVRQCVVTRERRPKGELVRLMVDPEGQVAIDLLDRAPGRGVYVRADRATLHRALTGKGMGKTFRGRVRPMSSEAVEALIDGARDRLDRRLLEMVGIARRAGVAAIGMDAVIGVLSETPAVPSAPVVVLTARDLSERSLGRVKEHADLAARFVELAVGKTEFGSKLGRSDVGVVAIRPSALATRIVAEAVRRDGLDAVPQSRARKEGLIRDNGEPPGGRSN